MRKEHGKAANSASASPFTQRLSFLIYRTATRLERKASRLFAELNIQVADARILVLVLEFNELRMSDLCDYLELPQPTVSHQVERLVKRKFLARNRIDDDARTITVSLTTEGTAIAHRCEDMSAEIQNMVASHLDAPVHAFGRWYLEQLHKSLGI